MKLVALNFFKLAASIVVVLGFSASAIAQCGTSLAAMAGAASVGSQSDSMRESLALSDDKAESEKSVHRSIVGLWHVWFMVGDQTIQEAYQIWNVGGTEVHNPNGDPRGGSVCLGAWKKVGPQTYKLAHRVWSHDTSGTFLGTIHLSETLTLGPHGHKHSGSFTLDFFDPQEKFMFQVSGNVVGVRISVE